MTENITSLPQNQTATITLNAKTKYTGQMIKSALTGNGWNIPMYYQDDATVSYAELELVVTASPLYLERPQGGEKWIAGRKDTIRWRADTSIVYAIDIEYSLDNGQTWTAIVNGYPADSANYVWTVPDTLSTKSQITIYSTSDFTIGDTSDVFKIKGFVLTKLSPTGDYVPYTMPNYAWGFGNSPNDVWPNTWWSQFIYIGIDPFTGSQYSQWQGGSVFPSANSSDHPDWVSFVKTFTVDACYISTSLGIYSATALARWKSLKGVWNGSCFGISTSAALAFRNQTDFAARYPNYPDSTLPGQVTSNANVIPVINELFTHQFGNPHSLYTNTLWQLKKPNQTLREIKSMLLSDSDPPRTLSIWNNSGAGGHSILAYKVKPSSSLANIDTVYVYDNAFPNVNNAFIVFDTAQNANQGGWTYPLWPNWGGAKKILLMDPSTAYLTNPSLSNAEGPPRVSSFVLSDTLLLLQGMHDCSVSITSAQHPGDTTGFSGGMVRDELPGSVPLTALTGSETPPYGYSLPTGEYTISLSNFSGGSTEVFLFTSNKTLYYGRGTATPVQKDLLSYDGNLIIENPDTAAKTVNFMSIINETTHEKVYSLRSVTLSQGDSLRMENIGNDGLKLGFSGALPTSYMLELEFAADTGIGRFGHGPLQLAENSSHLIYPDWTQLNNNQLDILIDNGNDGTIDDTLRLSNEVTDVNDGDILLKPTEYDLAQNYPNPFNPVTNFSFQVPVASDVTLKVYDLVGREVATVVNEKLQPGVYTRPWDAGGVASGVYFYRMTAKRVESSTGGFNAVRKLVITK